MTRGCWNIGDRKVGIVVLVFVSVTSTLNALARNDLQTAKIKEPHEPRRTWKQQFEKYSQFRVDSTLPSPETRAKDISVAQCLQRLLQRYPSICELASEIDTDKKLVDKIVKEIENRMGWRRFDIVLMLGHSRSALGSLADAVYGFSTSIRQVVQFLGAVELLLTMSEDTTVPITSDAPETIFPSNLVDFIGSLALNFTFPWDAVYNFTNHYEGLPHVDRRILKSCSPYVSLNSCSIMQEMDRLDGLLEVRRRSEGADTMGVQPAVFSSKNVSFPQFLEVISGIVSQVNKYYYETENDVNKMSLTEPFSRRRIIKDFNGKRRLVNGHNEDIAEIFETPNFRVEFIREAAKKNWHRETKRSGINLKINGDQAPRGNRYRINIENMKVSLGSTMGSDELSTNRGFVSEEKPIEMSKNPSVVVLVNVKSKNI